MRLSTHVTAPTEPSYEALRQFMCYLHHHLHLPIMYLRKQPKEARPVETFWRKGDAELKAHSDSVDPNVTNDNDADHGRDLRD